MPFKEKDSLGFFIFDKFNEFGIPHGIFTRRGGCSPKPWQSLNVATSVGDSRKNVMANRKKIMRIFDSNIHAIFDTQQIHSDDVVITDKPRQLETIHQKADGIITNDPNIFLMMVFADCVPIILFDPKKLVIGIVHAGWQGTVKNIIGNAIKKMEMEFDCQPVNIIAGIGPSICVDHYLVGDVVINEVKKYFPSNHTDLLINKNGQIRFDLRKANTILLESNGVKAIENANICTACNTTDWFSHRAEKGITGRFACVIGLGKA